MTTNKGFITEGIHHSILEKCFDGFKVSTPKGAATGSDFKVVLPYANVTFESKTSNTDLFDAGVLTAWANGGIHSISSFYSNTQVALIQSVLDSNVQQIEDHLSITSAETTSYKTSKQVYEDIRLAGKLICVNSTAPKGLVEASLTKGDEPKSNYVVIGDLVYRASENPIFDPLNLADVGVPALTEDYLKVFDIRSRRGGSDKNGMVRVGIRLSYKFKKILPETPIFLSSNFEEIVRAHVRKYG